MLNNDSIKHLLGITEKRLTIHDMREEIQGNIRTIVVIATLTKELSQCHSSAKQNDRQLLVIHGGKVSCILMNKTTNQKTILKLKKQRYHYLSCGIYFTLKTAIVDTNYCIAKKGPLTMEDWKISLHILNFLSVCLMAFVIFKICKLEFFY